MTTKSKEPKVAKPKQPKPNPQKKKGKGASQQPRDVFANVMKLPRNLGALGPKMSTKQSKSIIEAICSIFDPFCPEALGARIPDGQPHTFTAQARGTVTLTTGATGGLNAWSFTPAPPYGWSQNNALSFPVTMSAQATLNNLGTGSLFANYGDKCRIVSAGAILRATQSANAAQGYFTLQTQQGFTPGTSQVQGDFLGFDNTVVANYPGMETTYVFKPINKVLSRQFVTPGVPTSSGDLFGWPTLVIYYQGGVTGATNVAVVEYYMNIEFTVVAESSLATIAPKSQPAHPAVLKALDQVQETANPVLKAGIDAVGMAVSGMAKSAVQQVASMTAEELFGFLPFAF